MASTLAVVTLFHLVALVCCITSANLKVTDTVEDDDVKAEQVDADKEDDLDGQETQWLLDPIQKKMRELEYFSTKLLSPLSALRSPSFSYGGGSPVYSVGGGSGYNFGVRYPSYVSNGGSGSYSPSYTYSVPYYKPTNKFIPSYNTINWMGKGSSSLNYQQTTSNYAPDCFHPTSFQSSAAYVPSKFTYSKGTPLYVSYSSSAPTQTYGAPQGSWTKSAASSGFGSGSFAPVISQPSSVESGGFLIKASVTPQVVSDGLQPSSSPVLPGVSGYPGSFPSAPAVPAKPSSASWSTALNYYPTGPSALSFRANPPAALWSSVSGYPPSVPSAPTVSGNPSPAAWSTVSNYYPSGPSAPSIPANPPAASWATIPGNYPSGPKANPPIAPWSTVSGYYPSTPSSPSVPANPSSASWLTASNYYPSGPAVPANPVNPPSASWAPGSNYYPQGPSAPSAPSWSGATGNYPTSGPLPPAPPAPSTSAPPSWSSVSSSFPSTPQPPQAPAALSPPAYWSTFGGALPSPPPPVSQQYALIPAAPPAPIEQDQRDEEIVITPPPALAKGNIITSLPGPQVSQGQEPLYYPGSNYALSYYPNVFVITNEQRLEQPLSEETVKPSTESSTVASTTAAASTTSSGSTAVSLKSQALPEATPMPIQSNAHSSSTNERSKGPLVYSLPQPIAPPVSSIFYSQPQIQTPYPIPVNFRTSSIGAPQLIQSLPPTRTLLSSYPTSLGYSYSSPDVGVQPLPLPLPSSRSQAPC